MQIENGQRWKQNGFNLLCRYKQAYKTNSNEYQFPAHIAIKWMDRQIGSAHHAEIKLIN